MKSSMSQVKYQKKFPTAADLRRAVSAEQLIVIYDERLLAISGFRSWVDPFDKKLGVKAGEQLKNIDDFPRAVKNILPMLSGYSAQEIAIVAVGGGSVGDWAGFLASVLKRGVKYINIPSTWLAAIDSAHGGKTALNVEDYKNQVGSFYPAQVIYCVQTLLENQGQENIRSGYGEAIKMAILRGGDLYKKFVKAKQLDASFLWRMLPALVAAKYQIVRKDPYEKTGYRHILNLGHTLGHALELEQKFPHGVAVQMGIEFALEWSWQRGWMKSPQRDEIKKLLDKNPLPHTARIFSERLGQRIRQDKKVQKGGKVRFVFVKGPGRPHVEATPIEDLIAAARQLGWAQ